MTAFLARLAALPTPDLIAYAFLTAVFLWAIWQGTVGHRRANWPECDRCGKRLPATLRCVRCGLDHRGKP